MQYQISISSSASLTIFAINGAHLAFNLLNSTKMTTWAMLLHMACSPLITLQQIEKKERRLKVVF